MALLGSLLCDVCVALKDDLFLRGPHREASLRFSPYFNDRLFYGAVYDKAFQSASASANEGVTINPNSRYQEFLLIFYKHAAAHPVLRSLQVDLQASQGRIFFFLEQYLAKLDRHFLLHASSDAIIQGFIYSDFLVYFFDERFPRLLLCTAHYWYRLVLHTVCRGDEAAVRARNGRRGRDSHGRNASSLMDADHGARRNDTFIFKEHGVSLLQVIDRRADILACAHSSIVRKVMKLLFVWHLVLRVPSRRMSTKLFDFGRAEMGSMSKRSSSSHKMFAEFLRIKASCLCVIDYSMSSSLPLLEHCQLMLTPEIGRALVRYIMAIGLKKFGTEHSLVYTCQTKANLLEYLDPVIRYFGEAKNGFIVQLAKLSDVPRVLYRGRGPLYNNFIYYIDILASLRCRPAELEDLIRAARDAKMRGSGGLSDVDDSHTDSEDAVLYKPPKTGVTLADFLPF